MSTKLTPVVVIVVWILVVYSLLFFLPSPSNFPYSYEDDAIIVEGPRSLWHLANFDGAHYQNIVDAGYQKIFQAAFFPLYPLIIKYLGLLVSSHLLAAALISLICLLGSLVLFKSFSSRNNLATLFLISFPFSFFFLMGYTESLFLFLSISAWYFIRKKRYVLTGIFGFFASLSRFYGLLLFLPLLLEYGLSLPPSKRLIPKYYLKALPLLLIPAGLAVYMYYLNQTYQDPLQFLHSMSLWQKGTITFPLQTVYRYLKILFLVSPLLHQYHIALLELSSFLLGLILTWFLYKSRLYPYSLYLFLGTVIPVLTGTLQSAPRYLAVLFPVYLSLEHLPRKLHLPLISLSFLLQLYLYYRFLTGSFVS